MINQVQNKSEYTMEIFKIYVIGHNKIKRNDDSVKTERIPTI